MERATHNPNIARAVRRSRAVRSTMQRRQRRLLAGACAAILLGSGAFLSIAGVTGSDAVAAAVTQAQSLAQLLDQRSPGERIAGAQTKHKRVQALSRPRLRPRPHAPSATDLANILMPSGPLVTEAPIIPPVLADVVPVPQLGDIVAPPRVPGSGGGGPAIVGGGSVGGGGGGGSPGGSVPLVYPPHDTKDVIAAVPEPGTWATMLLGFGLMGWRLRRSNARRLLPS
jgi:hypothetical protein